jgi:CysZ protein
MQQIYSVISIFLESLTELKGGFVKYLLWSGLIALLLFTVLLYGIWTFSDVFGAWIAEIIPWNWAHESLLFSVVIGLMTLFICWFVAKYLLLMALSPVLSIVSEKIEKDYKEKTKSTFSVMSSAARSIRINLRNMIKELVVTVLLLVMSLIPGINILTFFLLFVVQSYFLGFGFMDFYLERHFTFSQTIALVWKHKWAAICIGSIFTFIILIPILGVLVAPYFVTVTATKYFAQMEELEVEIKEIMHQFKFKF